MSERNSSMAAQEPIEAPCASMPITVIMNAASGHEDKETAREQIERELIASGREFRILTARPPAELQPLVRSVVGEARQRPQLLVAAGGDGTVNTLVGEVIGTVLPLGVIPLGTFNYFARDLGIPLDPTAAARSLLDGRVRRLDVATVNGRVFLINSSFGLYRRLQEEREQNKRRFGRNKAVAILSALVTLLRHHRPYDVLLEVDGKPVSLRTPMVLFGANALQLEKLDLDVARCPAEGLLALLVLRPMGRGELLGFALRGALQGLDEARNLRSHCASRVAVHWRGARRIRVAIDGETADCSLPLHYEVARAALSVVVPRVPEPRQ